MRHGADWHHPWRTFRALVDWKLAWAHLPGDLMGHTDFATKTVTIDPEIDQYERRCTIDHETEHILRGPVHDAYREREERAIDLISARRLIPLERLVDAMLWCYHEEELAQHLWVDEPTLRVRLESLTDQETAMINQRLDAAELSFPADC